MEVTWADAGDDETTIAVTRAIGSNDLRMIHIKSSFQLKRKYRWLFRASVRNTASTPKKSHQSGTIQKVINTYAQ